MRKLSPKYLLLFLASLTLYCVFYLPSAHNFPKHAFIPTRLYNSNLIFSSKTRSDKFIFTLQADCPGLGNQLYRIASLYSIGLYPNVNRTPGLNVNKNCLENYTQEFTDTFPNAAKLVKFVVSFGNPTLWNNYLL